MDNRRAKLMASERAQQYFFDASEAESWMSEQELYMMVEDRGKDEISAQNLMKKHQTLELAVEDYAETIRQLGETSTQLIAEGHPDSDQIAVRQAQVDKLYAGLRDLAQERRAKLEEALQLFMLSREVDDLRQWIADREVVAGSHELGQDYDHVTLLWERFKVDFSFFLIILVSNLEMPIRFKNRNSLGILKRSALNEWRPSTKLPIS